MDSIHCPNCWLEKTLEQAKIHSNGRVGAWCLHLLAIIAEVEHFNERAIELEVKAREETHDDMELFTESAIHETEMLKTKSKKGGSISALKSVNQLLEFIETTLQTAHQDAPFIVHRRVEVCTAKLRAALGKDPLLAGIEDLAECDPLAFIEVSLVSIGSTRKSALSHAAEVGVECLGIATAAGNNFTPPAGTTLPLGRILAKSLLGIE